MSPPNEIGFQEYINVFRYSLPVEKSPPSTPSAEKGALTGIPNTLPPQRP
jgi:hypothetical protein